MPQTNDMMSQIQSMLDTVKPAAQAQAPVGQPPQFVGTPVQDAPPVQNQPPTGPQGQQAQTQDVGPTPQDMAYVNPPNLTGQVQKPDEQKPDQQNIDPTILAILQQNQALTGQMQQMQAQLVQMQQGQQAQQQPEEFKVPALQGTALVTAEDLKGVVQEDGKISLETLMKAMQQVGERSYQLSREHTYRDLSTMVEPMIERTSKLNSAATLFWDKNRDLAPFQERVSAEANKVYAETPGLTVNQVYDKAAEKVRADLKAYADAIQIQQQAQNPMQGNYPPAFVPAQVGGQNVRPDVPQQKPNSQQQQILDVLGATGYLNS